MTNPVDPNTGAPLHRGVRPLTLTYKAESITVDMPGWYGDDPESGVLDANDMKISDRALHRLKARAEGLPEPEEIRRIRRKLGLTQAEAGELIGGGPRAFQKYESGDYLPSRAISSALILLDHDPKSLDVLKARRASLDSMPIAATRRTVVASR
jgi:HTH-type transcriptional regulator/antitoxin MqsA